MALPHVSTRVRDVPGAIDAIRTLESRILAALEFLMISQTALAAEDAAAIRAGELPDVRHPRAHVRVERPRRRRYRRHHRRRVRLENVASRGGRYPGEHTAIQAWNTKKTRRSRQSSSYRDTTCPTQRDGSGGGKVRSMIGSCVSNLLQGCN